MSVAEIAAKAARLPPSDEHLTLPQVVTDAAAAAEAAHRAAYSTPQPEPPATDATPQPEPPATDATPQPEPPAADATPQPEPPRAPVPDSGEPGSWEHRYHAMKGRYDQASETIGTMQQQMQELGDELMRTQSMLRMNPEERQSHVSGQRAPGEAPRRLVTDEDVKTYGNELIEFVQRAAREAVAPEIQQTSQQVRQVSQRVGQTAQQEMHVTLDREVPDWRTIDKSPRFKNWCRSPDVYSGQLRGQMLRQAYQAADAPRVVAFFKGFLAEEQATGQLSAPQPQPQTGQPAPAPRQAAVALEALAAPGRPKPAGGDSPANAADKPVFTRAQISQFYANVRKGAYAGREAEKDQLEQAIFAAQREGRVRG